MIKFATLWNALSTENKTNANKRAFAEKHPEDFMRLHDYDGISLVISQKYPDMFKKFLDTKKDAVRARNRMMSMYRKVSDHICYTIHTYAHIKQSSQFGVAMLMEPLLSLPYLRRHSSGSYPAFDIFFDRFPEHWTCPETGKKFKAWARHEPGFIRCLLALVLHLGGQHLCNFVKEFIDTAKVDFERYTP